MKQADMHPYVDPQPERRLTYGEKLRPQPPFVWRPRMTEQELAEQATYIEKHNLPF